MASGYVGVCVGREVSTNTRRRDGPRLSLRYVCFPDPLPSRLRRKTLDDLLVLLEVSRVYKVRLFVEVSRRGLP